MVPSTALGTIMKGTDSGLAVAVRELTDALDTNTAEAKSILEALPLEDRLSVLTLFIINTNKEIHVGMHRLHAAVEHVRKERLWSPLYNSMEDWLADIDYDNVVGIIVAKYCRAQKISSKGVRLCQICHH